MAEYSRKRNYDVTFLSGTSSAGQITNHLNSRLGQLIESCGGSQYFETINMDLKYVNKANPSNFSSSESVTNVFEERVIQSAYTLQGYGNNPDTNVPAGKENVVLSYDKTVSPALAADVSVEDLSIWVVVIEYDKTVQIA